MSDTVSVRELREHLAEYLHAAERGQTFLITSHRRPVARIISAAQAPEGMPEIPGVRWARSKGKLSRPVSSRPVNTGEPISDWVIANRR
ncbi:MAG: type II toxin-antitoxin system prevent-host-death family antitoxin [Rhodocyclaceae bacterium]|jgi:prevent-host-death family protein|nr:type II toxin-antitoxin system prevent-host-death family antitoxin [Rhodocyclaceae bacterium]MCL4759827.1 type II toxin-antitoxin system prevent-host-death family antitoxin [Rhodocyclaceae bacterium]